MGYGYFLEQKYFKPSQYKPVYIQWITDFSNPRFFKTSDNFLSQTHIFTLDFSISPIFPNPLWFSLEVWNQDCVVPENIHTHPLEGHWKGGGGGGSQRPKYIRESMGLNWKFQAGGRVQTKKKPSMGEVWIFSGLNHTFQCMVDTGF